MTKLCIPKREPDGFTLVEVREYHWETWPAAHEDVLKPSDFGGEFEDADPGYSVVCFSLIDPDASPGEIEAFDIRVAPRAAT